MNKVVTLILFAMSFSVLLSSQQVFGIPSVTDPNFQVETVVSDLATPTTMGFLGPDDILVLQKNDGKVMRVLDGVLQTTPVLDLSVANSGERGLLGIAVVQSPPSTFVYLYFTEASSDGGIAIANHVYRYTWNSSTGQLESPQLFLTLPSTHQNHNGGVLATDLDGEVFAIIGDLGRNGILQNNPAGAPADDTSVIVPVLDPTHQYRGIGVRNSFGLTVDPISGYLWNTENGPEVFDEINMVPLNFNSGWRDIMGPSSPSNPPPDDDPLTIDQNGVNDPPPTDYFYSEPEFSWRDTNAPTAIAFIDTVPFSAYRDFAFVGDFNPGQIYAFPLNAARDGFDFSSNPLLEDLEDLVADDNAERDLLTFGSGFGIITDIKVGPDGVLYVVSLSQGRIFKISPIESHDMQIDAFSVGPLVVTQGDIVDLQATVTNLGNVDEPKARVNYRDTTDGGPPFAGHNFDINVGETQVGIVKQWDTSTASIGDHVLKAHVRPTVGFVDNDLSNNDMFVTVTVLPP